jgi:hypothetical protein
MGVDAWREDPDGGQLPAALGNFVVEMGVAEMDLPHIVLCRDSRGVSASFSGPYPSAIEALVAADIEQQIESESDGQEALTFHVAALYPALDPSAGSRGAHG